MIDSNQILGGNSLKKIIAKPVGMFELFYDLVFVYVISRITAMIHHPVNGSIPLVTFFSIFIGCNCSNANLALSSYLF